VKTFESVDSMSERYARAADLTAPRVAATPSGVILDGYWLDSNTFFFVADVKKPGRNQVVSVPTTVDVRNGAVEPAMRLDALATLLSQSSGSVVDERALLSAQFEMPDRDSLAVLMNGIEYLVDLQTRSVLRAVASFPLPALYSPDGKYACFLRSFDVWAVETSSGQERQLTFDGERHHSYARQPQTCLGELSYRQRPIPVGLWSPDSRWFVTHSIDEREAPDRVMTQYSPRDRAGPKYHEFKVAVPRLPLPMATYVAIEISCGKMVRFDGFRAPVAHGSPFLANSVWFGANDEVWLLRQDRYYKELELVCLHLSDGTGRIVIRETVDRGYIEPHPVAAAKPAPNVRVLTQSDEIIWFSERDGWGHLYLYEASTGHLKGRITSGNWLVRDIVNVDENLRRLHFLAGGIHADEEPARRSLCVTRLDGTGFEVIARHDGDVYVSPTEPDGGLTRQNSYRPRHAPVSYAPGGGHCVIRQTSIESGNTTSILNLGTRHSFAIATAMPEEGTHPPRHFAVLAADKETWVHGVMFLPPDFDENGCYPLIDYIYPGPHVFYKPQTFNSVNAAPAAALSQLGFVTIMMNTRGMPGGSRATHQAGYPALWEPQLADHANAVRELCKQYRFIDSERIGIFGHSAGGAATVRALFDYGDVFKIGVAVCPYNDPDLGPAGWMDKYQGDADVSTRAKRSVDATAHRLSGRLLLVSGDLDENVPFSHTLSLVDGLIAANRDFDLLIVPNETHLLMMTSGYVQRRIWDYFVLYLSGEVPPENFKVCFSAEELARFAKRYAAEFRQ
jgi:dipeptidyl-peptidase 4